MLLFGGLRRSLYLLCTTVLLTHNAQGATPDAAHYASQQTRTIATYFPGRMAGSPGELMGAEHLRHQLRDMGYRSDLREFNRRYLYLGGNGKPDWRRITATSAIAARPGPANAGEILVIAHADTYLPRSDKDLNNNLGGLTLQGVDDNAAGLGVMLALARELAAAPLAVGVRFVALSAGEPDLAGAEDYLARMTVPERQHTLLVINIDSLVAGEKLRLDYAAGNDSGRISALVKQVRDQARKRGIPLLLHAGIANRADCPSVAAPFARAGLPVLDLRAGTELDSCQQRRNSKNFPQGTVRYQSQHDNLLWLDRHLSGQLERRTKDSLALLVPLLKGLVVAPAANDRHRR